VDRARSRASLEREAVDEVLSSRLKVVRNEAANVAISAICHMMLADIE